jgi:hypothetical protein
MASRFRIRLGHALQCLEHSFGVSTTLDILDEGDVGPSWEYEHEIVVDLTYQISFEPFCDGQTIARNAEL